jgi:hypothetical protein
MYNNIGIDVGLPMDLSIGYEMPYYSDNQYHVLEFRPHALLGGESYITIGLYLMRINIFFEVIGAKSSLSAKGYYDVITRSAACYGVDWTFEAMKVKVTADIDVDECSLGILGIFLPGYAVLCDWKNNYIDYSTNLQSYTFYELNPSNGKFDTGGNIIPITCKFV